MPKRDDSLLFDDIKSYIALIGRGQKSGKTLTQEQARHLMTQLLSGSVLPEQIGALLMLLRMREETHTELAGFLQACRDTLPVDLGQLGPIDVDLGCYAGKRRHLPWLLLAVMLLAENGFRVFLHGLEETDSKRLYLDAVFRELNWSIATTPAEAKQQLDQHGFTYMSIASLHPAMTELLSTRHVLGLRSCMHTLAKMFNPAGATASVHGVFHRDLDSTHIEVARLLQEQHVACIRGDSGEVEATPEKPFLMMALYAGDCVDLPFPAILTDWSHQTRALTATGLKEVWTGAANSPYGEAAAIATTAVILATLPNRQVPYGPQLDSQQALDKAKRMWERRSKIWPELNP